MIEVEFPRDIPKTRFRCISVSHEIYLRLSHGQDSWTCTGVFICYANYTSYRLARCFATDTRYFKRYLRPGQISRRLSTGVNIPSRGVPSTQKPLRRAGKTARRMRTEVLNVRVSGGVSPCYSPRWREHTRGNFEMDAAGSTDRARIWKITFAAGTRITDNLSVGRPSLPPVVLPPPRVR